MDSGERNKRDVVVREKGVRIETLGLIIGSALLGAAAAVSILRSMSGGVETISMMDLLSFLLMLGLTSAAIVLAVVAISFSRVAERTIQRRNEDVRDVQVSIAKRTNGAIRRMQDSVEHMGDQIATAIYNNFNALSEDIQESLPSMDVLRTDVAEVIERALANSMVLVKQDQDQEQDALETVEEADQPAQEDQVEVAPEMDAEAAPEAEAPVAAEVTDEIRAKADKKYDEFKDIVLLGIANYPGVMARKIGEGHYRTTGDDLVDGAFIVKNEKLAVCTFCSSNVIADRFMGEQGDSFAGFLKSLFGELKNGHFTRVFMVFDAKLTSTSPYALYLNEFSQNADADTFAQFELFEGAPDVIIPELTDRVSQLMAAPDADDVEDDNPIMSFRQRMGS